MTVSFKSGHYTVIIKLQFLYINICSFSTIFIDMLAVVHNFVRPNGVKGRIGRSNFNGKAKMLFVW